jgi:hypothetical protein
LQLSKTKKVFLIEFNIALEKFHEFQKPFVTDKYLSLYQWQAIMSKIDRILTDLIKSKEFKDAKGFFNVSKSNYHLSYKFIGKEHCWVDWRKIHYEFDYIMQVSIDRKKQDRLGLKENGSIKKMIDDESTCSLDLICDENEENDPLAAPAHAIAISLNSSEENIPVPKTKKFKPGEPSSSKKKNKNGDSSQTLMDHFINCDIEEHIKANVTSRKKKHQKEKTSSSQPTATSDKIDQEKLNQMKIFNSKSIEEEVRLENRKIVLKDYAILDCKHLLDDDLRDLVETLEDKICDLYKSKSHKLRFGEFEFSALDLNTSNILTEKQILFVMRIIDNERYRNGNQSEEILDNFVLPSVIFHLFMHFYDMTEFMAASRLKLQIEKNNLFKLNDSN